jgi:hypothetical protein
MTENKGTVVTIGAEAASHKNGHGINKMVFMSAWFDGFFSHI